jgi:hypothetical protein
MSKKLLLRMTEKQQEILKRHLFPGDGCESVALAICGRLVTENIEVICINEIHPVPDRICKVRNPDMITWNPEFGRALFEKAAAKSMAILKIHSHPNGYADFSKTDDHSDAQLFDSLNGWCDDGLSHASAVMLPNGQMFGRFIDSEGEFQQIDRIAVVGDDIRFFDAEVAEETDETQLRTVQAFGEGTASLLKSLSIAIVGCSGTGSWMIEQLARLGVGELLLVDPDVLEYKNLNRIVGSRMVDAKNSRFKVDALLESVNAMGTGVKVTAIGESTYSQTVARNVAGCDLVVGCMDSIEGRDRLNRIATFYIIPYFDLGVRLDSDGLGGVSNICGNVNFLLPDGSSLLSRGCYSAESLHNEVMRRTNPEQYKDLLDEGYIKGAKVESPAVISINGFCATMAVNEILARLHSFRDGSNQQFRRQQFDLINSFWNQLDDSGACPLLSKYAGRGDMVPFLNSICDV